MSDGESAPKARRWTVLIVEDDDLLRGVTKRLLEKRGFHVLASATSAEASERLEGHEGPLHAVLMDINLPDGWGAELAQRLKAIRPEMAVVYTTGYAATDPVLAAGLADAEHVVHKPYTGDQVASVLRGAIESA